MKSERDHFEDSVEMIGVFHHDMDPTFAVVIGLDEGAIRVDRLFEGMVDIECAGITAIVAEPAAIIGAED